MARRERSGLKKRTASCVSGVDRCMCMSMCGHVYVCTWHACLCVSEASDSSPLPDSHLLTHMHVPQRLEEDALGLTFYILGRGLKAGHA